MTEKEILSANIVRIRKEMNMSQFEFAEECGISKDTLGLIERRIGNATIDTMQRIAACAGVTVPQLLLPRYLVLKMSDSYGIAYIDGDIVRVLAADISNDEDTVQDIVDICNKYDVALEHVLDVVYDLIG